MLFNVNTANSFVNIAHAVSSYNNIVIACKIPGT